MKLLSCNAFDMVCIVLITCILKDHNLSLSYCVDLVTVSYNGSFLGCIYLELDTISISPTVW